MASNKIAIVFRDLSFPEKRDNGAHVRGKTKHGISWMTMETKFRPQKYAYMLWASKQSVSQRLQ